jgi:nicotinic acid mononucleotide adenylyltransferase
MITYKELLEARKSTVVMAFGRLNPPTIGHELLVKAVAALAKKNNADHIIYVSRTQDAKKNPLTVDQKVAYARHSFKGMNIVGASDKVRTFIEAAKDLTGKYDNLIMIAGSDRILEYKQLLDRYNGKDFRFKSIHVVSAGERDPDEEGAAGMSASKMRAAAASDDFAKFKQGVPSAMTDAMARRMFDDVRAGMKLNEEVDEVREEYVNERVFNVGDIVTHEEQEKTIIHRGTNYVVLEDNKRVWLTDIKQTTKVNEAIMVKQQDKIKAARIIGMSLGYADAETKNDPTMIVNMALRGIRNKALNPETRAIIGRMLDLAKQMEISYDDRLLGLKEAKDEEEQEEVIEKVPLDIADVDSHVLMHGKGPLSPRAGDNEYKRMRKIHLRAHESTEPEGEEDDEDFDEDELVNSLSDDDIIEHGYDDDEIHVVDDETGEPIKEEFNLDSINEVLSRIERMRAKVRLAKTSAKRERAAAIALKRRSTTPVLVKRARRLAVKTLEMRLAKKPLAKLSIGEKERIEARIARMGPVITRIAVKMLPRVRKVESERLAHHSTQKA